MIIVRRATETGLLGFACGPDVVCKDCGTSMQGLVWYAERLVGMHHSEPIVELLCLSCARKAKAELVPKKKREK